MKNFLKIRVAIGVAMGMGIVAANAAPATQATTMYLEGNLGGAYIKDVDTNTYSGVSNGVTFTNLRGTLDYNEPTYGGIEFGFRNVADPSIRIGFSANTLKAKFQSATISGSISDGTTTYTGPVSVSNADLVGIGVDFDNRINLYSFNAYYDFSTNTVWTPFLGIGLGWADIENAKDNEFMYSLHAGITYDINPRVYVGARLGWYHIEGPTDRLGVSFENLKATTFGFTLGYRF